MQLTGSNTTADTANTLSTLRTEACGFVGSVYAARALLTFQPPPSPTPLSAPAYIDNLGVVKRSKTSTSTSRDFKKPDWDLFHEAEVVLANTTLSLFVSHVKSHQDGLGTPFNDLPLLAQLNIQADQAATNAYYLSHIPQPTPLLPSTHATLLLHGKQVTSRLPATIKLH
jgi:hypothetical protein